MQKMTDEEIMIEGLKLFQSQYQRRINVTFNPGVTIGKGGVYHGLITDRAVTNWRAAVKRAEELISKLEEKDG